MRHCATARSDASSRGRLSLACGQLGWRSTPDYSMWSCPSSRLDGLSRGHRAVAQGFAVNYAFNRHHHPHRPAVMYVDEFAAAWCGVSRSTAVRALADLRKRDVLRRVDKVKTTSWS